MNWGKGIIIGMGAFVAFITVLGVCMFKNAPTDYDKEYYEKGLAYDSVYVKEKQVIADNAAPRIRLQHKLMQIDFVSGASGTLRFERPENSDLDRTFAIKTECANQVTIPIDGFKTGQWQLTFEWKSNGKKYLYDREIYLP
jgi:hypothetical protein